jgi:hypothetical protein
MMPLQFPPPLVIEHWLLIVSGVMAWIGIPVLTYIAVGRAVRRAKTSSRKWQRGLSAFSVGSAFFIWIQWFHNPLPSDRFLMDYFQQHQAEFEQLVQGYRNYRRPDLPGNHYYEKLLTVRALMEMLSVNHIVDAQGPSGRWYPNHYSTETVQKEKLYFGWGLTIKNKLTEDEAMAILRREMPLVFEGVAPLHDVLDVARVTSVIYLFLEMGLIGLLWFKAVSIYKQPDDGVVQDFRL